MDVRNHNQHIYKELDDDVTKRLTPQTHLIPPPDRKFSNVGALVIHERVATSGQILSAFDEVPLRMWIDVDAT